MHNTTVFCIKDTYTDVNKPKMDEKHMAERVKEMR